jgi:peptidoglycan hydrolase-like protein with peptidoglycan-binding domain
LGRKSRAALRQYQIAHGMVADGYPNQAMLTALDQDAAKASGSN